MQLDDDPSWEFYPETILVFPTLDLEIDLREPLTRARRESLRHAFPGGPFAVITAANPRGQIADSEVNEERHAELRQELESRGRSPLECTGMSPCRTHAEPGLAASLPVDAATELARRFGQSAWFYYDGEAFWLQPGLVIAEPRRLPKAPHRG